MIDPSYYDSKIFKDAFRSMTSGMEDHQFKHYNVAMGVNIVDKDHYIHEMKKRGMVPFNETERLAEQWDKEHPRKEYDDISPRAKDIIRSLKLSADSNGNIKLGQRAINALIEIGAIKPQSEHAPTNIPQGIGGFST